MKKTVIKGCMLLFAVAGCQQELVEPENQAPLLGPVEFYAELEDFTPDTKTSLNGNRSVIWSEGDHLAIFQGSTLADKYQVKEGYAGGTNTIFSILRNLGGIKDGDFSGGTEIPFETNIAIYPFEDDLVCTPIYEDEDIVSYQISNVTIPSVQSYVENSFAEEAFAMTAITADLEDHNLKFKNVCGGLKFQFKGSIKVTSISIEGNDDEMLSGDAVVTAFSNCAEPKVEMKSTASSSVLLDCGDGVQLYEDTATAFIVALPPTPLDKGFTVTITDSEGNTLTLTSDKSNPIKRSVLRVMPEIVLESPVPTPPVYGETFNENQYLLCSKLDKLLIAGDSYYIINPCLNSRVSQISEIELKFHLASDDESYLFYSKMPNTNNGVLINSEGIVFRWDNSGYESITNEKILTWEEIGIAPTVKMVLKISVSKGVVTINGKQFPISEVRQFSSIEYLFSAKYYERDDGAAHEWYTVPTGTKLYYAKIWDADENLIYYGYASQGDYYGNLHCGWKSEFNGASYIEYSKTNMPISGYDSYIPHYEGGIDNDATPIDCVSFDSPEVKEACLAAFDTDHDNELSYVEAAAVTDLSAMSFPKTTEVSFDELELFSSLETIPEEYFANSKLISIKFPKSLRIIGKYAFNNCPGLSAISLPENIELKYGAFRACTGLIELTIPSGITWTTDAFYKCAGLKSVIISKGVEYIPDCAFQDCTNLTSVTIPTTVKKLWGSVFYNCTSMKSITIPDSVTEMSTSIFAGCTELVNVNLSNNITRLSMSMFDSCSSLVEIKIPESVAAIGSSCFYNCSSLVEIIIPESVTAIDSYCFDNCTSLTTVSVKSATPPTLGNYIFDDCTQLSKIYVPSNSYSKYQNGTYWWKYKSKMVGTTFN